MQEYINSIKKTISVDEIQSLLESFKDLKVLVIGDTIIDHYFFTHLKGRATKDPILSVEYKYDEVYAGGILAIANHLSDFVSSITLVTLIGDQRNKLDFIQSALKSNIKPKLFTKKDSPTTVKKRYVNQSRGTKLFKVEYINDRPIDDTLSNEILQYLDQELPKADLVIIGDFGHGFINPQIRKKLEQSSKFLSANVQSNSANMGYNYFSSYEKLDFLTLKEEELRLPLRMRYEKINEVIDESYKKYNFKKFSVTLGQGGSIHIKDGTQFFAPILTTNVKDTIGAGDALFSITSLLAYKNSDPRLLAFMGNVSAGIAVNIVGNKESVTKEKIMNFVKGVYNEMGPIQK
ncbi:PfkB family carbohydrate kinase [Nanoarchaeota archaeon]